MQMDQITSFYNQQFDAASVDIVSNTKNFRKWMFIRLIIFLATVVSIYYCWGNWNFVFLSFVAGITLFLIAVTQFENAKTALNKSKKRKELIQNELKALSLDFHEFQDGSEFKNSKHAFSYDMDLFGPKSVFQFLNRTFSPAGERMLAEQLLNGVANPQKVNRQIEGLSEQIEWAISYRVNGSIEERKDSLTSELKNLEKLEVKNPKWLNFGRRIFTLVGITGILGFSFDLINGTVFSLCIVLNMLVVGSVFKDTNKLIGTIGHFEGKIKMLLDQIELFEKLTTNHSELLELKALFSAENGAKESLTELLKIQKRFEFRMNLLVGFILNSFLVWDLYQRIALEKWMRSYQGKLSEWERKLTEMEVLISGAFVRFNNPNTCYTEWIESEDIHAEDLKHPLIPLEKVVSNDLKFNDSERLMILTGPNMAGKSTYLRSVGLLFVFANAGFPVFAKSAQINRYELFSSMRTSDDLSNESSYFHAELTRLKFILDQIEAGKKVFILLDEILKGTNSVDKEQGSKQFLLKLKRLSTQGIIATHDLALCDLAKEHEYFFNGYFDSLIQNDELYFDYLWKRGICQNMNASFLLKKMNLVD